MLQIVFAGKLKQFPAASHGCGVLLAFGTGETGVGASAHAVPVSVSVPPPELHVCTPLNVKHTCGVFVGAEYVAVQPSDVHTESPVVKRDEESNPFGPLITVPATHVFVKLNCPMFAFDALHASGCPHIVYPVAIAPHGPPLIWQSIVLPGHRLICAAMPA